MHDIFLDLQKLASLYPDKIDIIVDEDGEVEFEIDYDYFMENIDNIFGVEGES